MHHCHIMNLNIHPICYFDMVESEFEHFKRQRELKRSNKFVELSKVSKDEVNKENQLISLEDQTY